MVTIPIGCSIIAPENINRTKKGAHEVCEPTGGSTLTRADHVDNIKYTFNYSLRIVA